ncbi:MAG: two-component system response regulator [Gammaproteobacteria bacterium]|nr:MAG: two-component system response regulator [Gammaproteobacteria bacterium]
MSKTVLIVDDEEYIVTSLEYVVKSAGYEVVIAYDGEQAMEKVTATVPDLLILDVMMPKLDGFEVCEKIRANPLWKSIRIIMLTAKGRDSEREKGMSLGADAYMTKPFSTRDILKRVEELLGDSET